MKISPLPTEQPRYSRPNPASMSCASQRPQFATAQTSSSVSRPALTINLGDLRVTDGSINPDVPPGADIAPFQDVVIWCRVFAVFLGSAPLIVS